MSGKGRSRALTKGTNQKRERFKLEYLKDLNATQAAIRAGYSRKTAKQIGYELVHDPEIAPAIEAALHERAERVGLTADEILREIKVIALSRVDHYEVGDDGRIKVREGVPEEALGAVASFKRRTRRIVGSEAEPDAEIEDVEFRTWDKVKALELGARHLAMKGFTPADETGGGATVNVTFVLPVAAADAREWQRRVAERRGLPVGAE